MYKRIPATYFDSFNDIYYAMIAFMQECGFTLIDSGATQLFTINTDRIKDVCILQDPNSAHKLCLVLHVVEDSWKSNMYKTISQEFVTYTLPDSGGRIALFVFDEYYNDKYIHEQGNIAKRDGNEDVVVGLGFFDNKDNNNQRRGTSDLICIYNNRSLIFVYVPTNCYIYSHIYDNNKSCGGHMLYYGNFTKYHLDYSENIVFAFSTMCKSEAGIKRNINDSDESPRIDSGWADTDVAVITNPYETNNDVDTNIYGILYCDPEATYAIGGNHWFAWNNLTYDDFLNRANTGKATPPLASSFDICDIGNRFRTVNYVNFYSSLLARGKAMFSSTLNNTSVLMPLIIYGMREPKVLFNWSAIGETRLVSMIDMSHLSSGEIYMDTGIEEDYHKYFVFPACLDYEKNHKHKFLGLAVEISARERLLNFQSTDRSIISLTDSFRNYSRIKIDYDGGVVEWDYFSLRDVFDTAGVFNLTKDINNQCLVYGLKHPDGDSTEYRFNCSVGCKINSITGYRE